MPALRMAECISATTDIWTSAVTEPDMTLIFTVPIIPGHLATIMQEGVQMHIVVSGAAEQGGLATPLIMRGTIKDREPVKPYVPPSLQVSVITPCCFKSRYVPGDG